MKVYKEVCSANDFDFWGGAKDTVKYLTDDEIETIFSMLEDSGDDEMSETEVNDFFWFEDDTIAEWLGWSDFETLMKARSDGLWCADEDEYNDFLEEEENEEDAICRNDCNYCKNFSCGLNCNTEDYDEEDEDEDEEDE